MTPLHEQGNPGIPVMELVRQLEGKVREKNVAIEEQKEWADGFVKETESRIKELEGEIDQWKRMYFSQRVLRVSNWAIVLWWGVGGVMGAGCVWLVMK